MIRITNGDRTTELAWDGAPVSVSRLLERAGLHPDRPCGGQGRCGKCRVLARGDLSPAAPEERKHLTAAELDAGVRLACMARICGPDADIGLPREGQLLVETGLPLHRLTWEPWAAGLGVSVDIGTTTVAAYLWDLDGRRQLGVASCKNPQERLGADVVSRLDASLAGRGGELRTCITACIAELARRLCRQAGRPVTDIGGAVITGNTAMLYLLRGLDVHDIALAPFQARYRFGEYVPASELGLPWGADCRVYLPPCISAYVGADITCGLLACGALQADGPALLADVGTNGEMALLSGGTIYCCATAAGPAFEGVGISCGSGAVPGAIDAVTVSDGALRVHVIGGGAARSLCGSGLLDAVAALRQLELVEDSGFMEADALPLAPGAALLRRDIRAFQLAKSAVCAGVDTLLHTAGLRAPEVKTVWLAGGFGCRLLPESAGAVGMLPLPLVPSVRPVGNAAAAGAALLLCARRFEPELAAITAASRVVELAADPVFQERFVEDMLLSEVTE